MLASTFLSAATALFFLPSVFSAPIAPATSVAVPEVDTTTISTTRSVAIQKVTTVFIEKKSELDAIYDNLVNVDTSKIDQAFVTQLFGHVSGVLRDTINGVQAASTTIEDSVAVEVEVAGLVEAVAGLVITVFRILGHVVMIVDDVLAEILPIVASVLVVVIDLLKVVGSLVAGILVLVGEVVVKVEGVVDLLKALIAYDLTYLTFIVGFMGIKLN
ncbi:hypothetical protein M407DRAFT_19870 [Tulasnella calospora MUT 4182]|uniref:Uncharacterized protein n=1 Tax=Tulasnella calospora MUT 4182 TaxID=1051891 RepID=A0A0C3MB80_9AGAM|nr:hypothetical protein M407DRAFT_19870 [Tulasnella calospora MUT 4182]